MELMERSLGETEKDMKKLIWKPDRYKHTLGAFSNLMNKEKKFAELYNQIQSRVKQREELELSYALRNFEGTLSPPSGIYGEPNTFDRFICDMKFYNWRLLKNFSVSFDGPFQPEVTLLTRHFEEELFGDEVIERTQKYGDVLGQKHAEYLLTKRQGFLRKIDDERVGFIAFPGTIWLRPPGIRYIPVIKKRPIAKRKEKWCLEFTPLDTAWHYYFGNPHIITMK